MRSSLQGSWIGSEERWLDFAKATGAQRNPKKQNTTRPGRWQPLSRPPSRLRRDSDAGIAIPRLGEKALLEGVFVSKRVYTLSSRRAKESIPAKGGEKRCLVLGDGS